MPPRIDGGPPRKPDWLERNGFAPRWEDSLAYAESSAGLTPYLIGFAVALCFMWLPNDVWRWVEYAVSLRWLLGV